MTVVVWAHRALPGFDNRQQVFLEQRLDSGQGSHALAAAVHAAVQAVQPCPNALPPCQPKRLPGEWWSDFLPC